MRITHPIEDILKWAEDYKSGMSLRKLEAKYGVGYNSIGNHIKQYTQLREPPKKMKNKLSFYENTAVVANGCVEWVGCLSPMGYGRFYVNGKSWEAHRYSYYLKFKKDPKNLCVCHKCDNPLCVNPKHLFLGTQQDNIRDKMLKGRCAIKLDPDKVRHIRSFLERGRSMAKVAKLFGVSLQIIADIKYKNIWAWVE